jgi:predicted ArsR family transcriptional regulator
VDLITNHSPDSAPEEAPERPLSAEEFHAAVTAVTNAFGDPTRRAIYLLVRDEALGLTTGEVAELMSLHPNVARHHLEKLTHGGYLTVAVATDHGARSAGRPSKRYCVSAVDHSLSLPLQHDDVLATLLARALDALGAEQAEHLADEVGYTYGQLLAERMEPGTGHRSARAAVTAVADALTAHGFAAHAEADGDSLSIVSECCPFGETAQHYPHVVCALDRGMIRGMLSGLYGETSPKLEASRPEGDDRCVARL